MPAFFGPEGPGRIDLSRLMSRATQQLMADAARAASARGDADLDALHVLRVMAEQDPVRTLMQRAGADPKAVVDAVDQRLPQVREQGGFTAPLLSGAVKTALLEAHQLARALGSTYIDPEHLFIALAGDLDHVPGRLLASAGITPEKLQAAVQNPNAGAVSDESATPMLDKFGVDLTDRARNGGVDPVIGRGNQIEDTIEILSASPPRTTRFWWARPVSVKPPSWKVWLSALWTVTCRTHWWESGSSQLELSSMVSGT